jgi:hypothetical protein
VPDDKAAHDKALELLVYAPVGVALYLRDMLPSMMPLFVSRGKREVQSHLPGGVPTPPAPPMPPMPPMPTVPTPPSAADMRRKVEEGLGIVKVATDSGVGIAKGVAGGSFDLARGLAGSALQGLGSMRGADGAVPASPSLAGTPATDTPAPAAAAATPPASSTPASETAPSASPAATPAPDVETLAIPDYDELSASQVVERLVGLDHASLDAIRRYELAHRGRNTILGKITQLG